MIFDLNGFYLHGLPHFPIKTPPDVYLTLKILIGAFKTLAAFVTRCFSEHGIHILYLSFTICYYDMSCVCSVILNNSGS